MDNKFPKIGFGTWKITGKEQADLAVREAYESGYRFFDTASAYENEKLIGEAIQSTGCSRKEVLISGKVWNSHRGYEKTLKAFEATCKNLQVDYLDAYLIHWPASPAVHEDAEEINAETWKAMEKLYNDGYVKAIGVCNFLTHHLENLAKTANIKPMINQIEYHPGFVQEAITDYCKEQRILVQGWSPLGSGKLLKKAAIKEIAERYQRTPAQVCLRWCVQKGIMPVVKSVTPERIQANISIFDFVLAEEDMEKLNELPYTGSGLNPDEIMIFG